MLAPRSITFALLGMLVACQPLPRPFAPDADKRANPLLNLTDRAGIIVLDVDGAPHAIAAALQGAVADALLERNVPATIDSGNSHGRFLQGEFRRRELGRGVVEVELIWDLVSANGDTIGHHVVTGKLENWAGSSIEPLIPLVRSSALGVAAMVQERAPRQTVRISEMKSLFVPLVASAPGNGPRALQQAMIATLRRAKLDVAHQPGRDSLTVVGHVKLGPSITGRQPIEIIWSVRDSDDREIGNLKQNNSVETGSLDGDWGTLAFIIAESARNGVIDILRLRPENSRRHVR